MQAERNVLHDGAFANLREYCRQRDAKFQVVDLRWGISEEAGLDQQTINICLEELRRSQAVSPRPNFVVLLGDRYGWRPLPPQIDADEFEQILHVVSDDERRLLAYCEEQPDDDDRVGWYRKDENAVPPQYVLKPRSVTSGELTDEQRDWAERETRMRETLVRAINQLGWDDSDSRRFKYEASATHQEIQAGALSIADADEHVLCYLREISGLPDDESARDFRDFSHGSLDQFAVQQIERLKDQLRRQLSESNIYDYEAQWDGQKPQADLHDLSERVETDLRRIIDAQLDIAEKTSPVEHERERHDAFAVARAAHFQGRQDQLAQIDAYVTCDLQKPLFVCGHEGSGKSAFMSRVLLELSGEIEKPVVQGLRNETTEVVARFIGATPRSTHLSSLLRDVIQEICDRYDTEVTFRQPSVNELANLFQEAMGLASEDCPLVVILDALDQLDASENAEILFWIPDDLPPHVKLVSSVLVSEYEDLQKKRSQEFLESLTELFKKKKDYHDEFNKLVEQSQVAPDMERALDDEHQSSLGGTASVDEIVRRRFPDHQLTLPPLDGDNAAIVLDAWLLSANRSLRPMQRQHVLDQFEQSGLPLYLKLAFEQAKNWRSFDDETATPLATDVSQLIKSRLAWLARPENHGDQLVRCALGYLVSSRHGLAEDELLDLLAFDNEFFEAFVSTARHQLPDSDERRLPLIVWSRLRHDIAPYLAERVSGEIPLLSFFHRAFGKGVRASLLAPEFQSRLHNNLAEYFQSQPHSFAGDGPNAKLLPNRRKITELPRQLLWARSFSELEEHLCNLKFIQAACEAGLLDDLISVYTAPCGGEESRLVCELSERLREFDRFVSNAAAALRLGPREIAVTARIYAADNSVTQCGQQLCDQFDRPWIARDPRPVHPGGDPFKLRTLYGHSEAVTALSLSPAGRLLVSASRDSTVRVWDVATGTCIRVLSADDEYAIHHLAISWEHSYAVTNTDRTFRVWDLRVGHCLGSFQGDEDDYIHAMAMSKDVDILVTGASRGIVKIWSVETGKCLNTIETGGHRITAAAMNAYQRAIFGHADGRISYLNFVRGDGRVESMAAHAGEITSICVSGDRNFAISASEDGQLYCWTIFFGSSVVYGHRIRALDRSPSEARFRAVACDREANTIVAADDHTLTVWGKDAKQCYGVLGKHSWRINTVDVDDDANIAAAPDGEGEIHIWDLRKFRTQSVEVQREKPAWQQRRLFSLRSQCEKSVGRSAAWRECERGG